MSVTIATRLSPDATRAKFAAAVVAASAIVALTVGRTVFVPLSLAVLIAFALAPLVELLRRYNVGRVTSIATAVGVASAVVACLALFLSGQFAELADAASPGRHLLNAIDEPMPLWLATSLAEPLLNPFASAGVAVLFSAVLLLHKERLTARFARFADAGHDFGRHLLTQGVLDLSFGMLIATGLWAMGVPQFGLWALVGVMLRSVPFVGVAVAALCPLMIDPNLALTCETLLLFLAIDGALQLVERRWLQRKAPRLSAFAAVGATIAWTCLWGLTGLMLAVPLTLGAVMLGRHLGPLSVLNRLLAAQAPATPPPIETPTEALALAARELAPDDAFRDPSDHAAPVLCIAGPGIMDEAAAGLLAEALRRKGILGRVVSFEDTLPAALPRLDTRYVRAVCVTCLDAHDQDGLRKLVRRIRPRLRDARVVAGLWSWSADALMDLKMAECDLVTTQLGEAAAHIERLAREAEAAALAA